MGLAQDACSLCLAIVERAKPSECVAFMSTGILDSITKITPNQFWSSEHPPSRFANGIALHLCLRSGEKAPGVKDYLNGLGFDFTKTEAREQLSATPGYLARLENSRTQVKCQYCGESNGKLMRCARCRSVLYCGAQCQRAHWEAHKKHCRKVKKKD